mgnify:CR=1 FL=1
MFQQLFFDEMYLNLSYSKKPDHIIQKKVTMIYAVTSSSFKQFLKNGDSTKMSAKEFA